MTQGIRAQQREQTRQALVRESRRLFSTVGYGSVGLSEIVHAAGVTKGALYHHFSSKADLFRAVLEQVQQEVAERIAETADAREDTWEQLVSGCRAFLTVSTDPTIQRIMLVDGPAVLGWSEWRAMNETTSGRHLAQVLGDLIDEGVIAAQRVEPLTHLLSGAMNEAALWLATSTDPRNPDDTQDALVAMLESLRVA
ncbi:MULTISPECIES: TetR/AcrR family transcriptional regulator [Streptomyces]|uniref:TetR/AcrR family transcriptional regulator n=1 Tax=Streptomyces prasinus TaxID=67345 RepID=A0ABX6B1B8_9ACTN|nr:MULTISPECIES: TetR/AcrR family transcriptional regulator [Streptomyces]MCP3769188.1 TetR/AcrR family transcriptional regulator [Streptomyces sp. MAR25Y5]QEV08808.1 TetR/AcrR family transcriptional regulator [Streptomyces prasinus]